MARTIKRIFIYLLLSTSSMLSYGSYGISDLEMENLEYYAELGDYNAQMALGELFFNGAPNVYINYAEAFKWYQKAADDGDAFAQTMVGIHYYKGLGVEQDYQRAFYWTNLAAKSGNAEAKYLLGVMYQEGRGMPQNYTRAINWYHNAALDGERDAAVNLGHMYFNGLGVKQNYAQAYLWYTVASASTNKMPGIRDDLIIEARDIAAQELTQDQLKQAMDEASKIFRYIRSNHPI